MSSLFHDMTKGKCRSNYCMKIVLNSIKEDDSINLLASVTNECILN